MNKNNYVAIMAGGIGSRFWPVSRKSKPKQFLDILNTGQTLLQSTYARFAAFIPEENIFIVTAVEYESLVKEQLPNFDAHNILCEPSRKNTAPCIAYISYRLMQQNPEANLICAPADHLILDGAAFEEVCLKALDFTENIKALVTLGIEPHSPNTGYGYIQFEPMPVSPDVYKVKTFTEKPNLELAKTFVASGEFLWNAGIFAWKVKNIVAAFEKLLPEIHEVFDAGKKFLGTDQERETIEHIYPQVVNISIDYGIMEKAENVYVIPASFGWSDLGTWASAYDTLEKDYFGNAVGGDNVFVVDAINNMVHAKAEKLVVLQGIENLIVVDTDDVLLICKKENEQNIKEYVGEIKRTKGERFL
jgi:mannose-1-phosphate guanylyltransferase